MKRVLVLLQNPEKVQEFVEVVTGLEGAFDLVSGNYLLDARSLMGIFSLDLTRPIPLNIEKDTPDNMSALEKFIVQDAE